MAQVTRRLGAWANQAVMLTATFDDADIDAGWVVTSESNPHGGARMTSVTLVNNSDRSVTGELFRRNGQSAGSITLAPGETQTLAIPGARMNLGDMTYRVMV